MKEDMPRSPWSDFDIELFCDKIFPEPCLAEETALLETIIPGLSQISIQKIIRDTNPHVFTKALMGASGKVRASFFRQMTKSSVWLTNADIAHFGELPLPEIAAAQLAVLGVYNNLLERGEIIRAD